MYYVTHFNCGDCDLSWQHQPTIVMKSVCSNCNKVVKCIKSEKFEVTETIHYGPITVLLWNPKKTGGAATYEALQSYEVALCKVAGSRITCDDIAQLNEFLKATYDETGIQLNYEILS